MNQQHERYARFSADLEEVRNQLYRFIFALLRNLDDTQEVYQQVCLLLWEKYDEFEQRSSFATWACGVARLKVLEFRRQQSRERAYFSQPFEEELASVEMSIAVSETDHRREALAKCLEKLPDSQSSLVRECYGGERAVSDVAMKLGRSTHSIYKTLRRVREKLFECVDRTLAMESHA